MIRSDLHRWPFDELRRISRIVREEKINVIHTHTSRSNFFGVLVRWLTGVPSVATAHSCHIQLHWMFNDWVIAVSEATRQYQRRYNLVRNSRIETIYNAIDPAHLVAPPRETRLSMRQSLGCDAATPLLGVVGNVIPRKGLIHLVRAMPNILAAAPAARLLVVGGQEQSDYGQKVRAEAEKIGIAGRLAWLGYRAEPPRNPRVALDLFVLPSLDEGLPLAVLEAMAAGLAVVATAVGGVPECVISGETGLLVPPGQSGPLAAAIIELRGDAARRRRMGEAGRRLVLARFGFENQINRVEAVLARAMRRTPVPGGNTGKASATQPPTGTAGQASSAARRAA